jgi:hypothetical protein
MLSRDATFQEKQLGHMKYHIIAVEYSFRPCCIRSSHHLVAQMISRENAAATCLSPAMYVGLKT